MVQITSQVIPGPIARGPGPRVLAVLTGRLLATFYPPAIGYQLRPARASLVPLCVDALSHLARLTGVHRTAVNPNRLASASSVQLQLPVQLSTATSTDHWHDSSRTCVDCFVYY